MEDKKRTLRDILTEIDNKKSEIIIKNDELGKLEKEFIDLRNKQIIELKNLKNKFDRVLYTNKEIAQEVGVKLSVVTRVLREAKDESKS